jgi:hypothetical protein
MNISEVLKNIELNEEQQKALDTFFAEYAESIKTSTETTLRESITEELKTAQAENLISKEDAEKTFEMFKEDAEKAFELFKADAEKAFELFNEDATKAADLMLKDAQNEYTENMTRALQDIYESIETRVKSDFCESNEFKALEAVKAAVAPVMMNEDYNKVMEELEALKAEKNAIVEEKEELTKEKVIETLIKDLPEQYVETVRKFVSNAKNEDEIYERWNSIVEMLQADPSGVILEAKKAKEDDLEDMIEDEEEELEPEEDEEKEDKKEKKSKKKSKKDKDEDEDEEDESEDEEKEDEDEESEEEDEKEEKETKKSKKSKKDDFMVEEAIFNITKKDKKDNNGLNFFNEEDVDLISLAFPKLAPRK